MASLVASFLASGCSGGSRPAVPPSPPPAASEPGSATSAPDNQAGVYATFDVPRTIVLGRSGGYTRVPDVSRLAGTLLEARGDTLVVLVARVERLDGSPVGIPLGACARLVPSDSVRIQRGGVPEDNSASRRLMRGVLLGIVAGAVLLAIIVGGWNDPS